VPAQEIADLYKRRWQIELFFRLMKQTLRITKFVGRSENAVRIQIAVAFFCCTPCNRSAKKPAASSSSFDSCAPISCTEKTPLDSEIPRLSHPSTPASCNSPSSQHEPDSRGFKPEIAWYVNGVVQQISQPGTYMNGNIIDTGGAKSEFVNFNPATLTYTVLLKSTATAIGAGVAGAPTTDIVSVTRKAPYAVGAYAYPF
jgi:hypothetical protein